MTAYANLNDLPEATRWIRHSPCGVLYDLAQGGLALDDDGCGKLCCEVCGDGVGSGYGGFILAHPGAQESTGGHPYAPVPMWLLRGEGPALTPVEFRVVLAIWSHEFGKSYGWPTLETLSRETASGVSTIKRALALLEGRGLVTRRRSAGRRATRYSVAELLRGAALETSNRPAPGHSTGPLRATK